MHALRRSIARTLALVGLLAMAGCSPRPPLRIGTSGDYPPFSMTERDGAPRGFDLAVAETFAADRGQQLQPIPFRWPELVAAARQDAFDLGMSGITLRVDRALALRFSRPYAVTGAVAVIRRDDAARFRSMADLERVGVRLVVNRGGHLERVTRARFPAATIATVDDNTQLPAHLRTGAADAVISESLEAATWPSEAIVVLPPFTRDRKVYVATAAHADALAALDAWLVERERDGWMNAQRRRWLGGTATMTPLQWCGEAIAAAIELRLQLMPSVAAAKREAGLPVDDPEQEERVLGAMRQEAAALGLDGAAAEGLFGELFVAAKRIQRAASDAEALPGATLPDLRAAIAAESSRLLREASRCREELQKPEAPAVLTQAFTVGIAPLRSGGLHPQRLAAQTVSLVATQ